MEPSLPIDMMMLLFLLGWSFMMKGGTAASSGASIGMGVDQGPNGLLATDMKFFSSGFLLIDELTTILPCAHVASKEAMSLLVLETNVITHSPFGARTTAGLCAHTGQTTPATSYWPSAVSDTACTTRLLVACANQSE